MNGQSNLEELFDEGGLSKILPAYRERCCWKERSSKRREEEKV